MKLTQYYFDEIMRLQSRIKFAEKLISFFLYVALYAFIFWAMFGLIGWILSGTWGFQELKFCNIVLSRGCILFVSNIYALDLFLNWFFELSILAVIFIFALIAIAPMFSYINSSLDGIRKIKELEKK